MIKLRLQRLERRSKVMPQSGIDQSIYRVLCIAMIDEEGQGEGAKPPLYTAPKVTRFGFDPIELKEIYADHQYALYHWAKAKDFRLLSDNVDESGKLLRPAMWTKRNWQERTADILWNKAVAIFDEACDMDERNGQDGDTYWYSMAKGVYRVPIEEYEANLEEIRAIYATIKEARSRGKKITEAQALATLPSKEPDEVTECEEKKPLFLRPFSIRFRKWMVAALFVVVVFAAPPIRNAFDILYSEGVGAAQEIVNSFVPQTPEELFQQAGVDYRAGHYEEAVRKIFTILADDGIPNHLRANCWYLLASVDWETGNGEAAVVNYRKAYPIYEASSDLRNLYHAALGLAVAYISTGNLDSSEESLELALDHYYADGGKYISDLGEYYAAAIDLKCAQNDYEGALHLALLRYEEIRGNAQKDQLAGAESDLGFWYAANGCLEKAQLFTFQAANIIYYLRDDKRHISNQINWILINKLQGFETNLQAVDFIGQWAKIQKDSRVEFYLDLALSLEPTKENADEHCFQDPVPR